MPLTLSGTDFRQFLQDQSAWPDYGGYESVVLSVNAARPVDLWRLRDIHPQDRVEVISGYRLAANGSRLGCFIASVSAWLLGHDLLESNTSTTTPRDPSVRCRPSP